MLNILKSFFKRILVQRVLFIKVVFVVLFSVLMITVFKLQIIKGDEYQKNFELKIQKTKPINATRGNIYDRNGNPLAYNDLAYNVTIEDNGTYDDVTSKKRNKSLNKTIKDVIALVEECGDKINSDFGISLSPENKYIFNAENETLKKRFLADVYGYAKIGDLSEEQLNSSADDVMKYLMSDERYDLKNVSDKKLALQIINIRYLMTQKAYTKYIATIIASDVNEKTVAVINENKGDYPGIDVVEDSVRRYDNPECFSSIIGYTGIISDDEYAQIDSKNKKKYSLQSMIGKAGIEQIMDNSLQGTPGEETLFVDSVGKVLMTTDVKNPKAGDNVYLSIDKDIQIQAYQILEREIAGIVLRNMIPDIVYEHSAEKDSSTIKIPFGDICSAFFSNGILNVNKIAKSKEKNVQKKVYKKMLEKEQEAINNISNEIKNPSVIRNDYSDELEELINYYVRTFLVSENLMDEDSIDSSDAMYKNWSEIKSITLRDYLSYGISRNWFNLKKLGVNGSFSDTDKVIDALIKYSVDELKGSYTLDLICYKYMVYENKLTPQEVCAMAMEQGVFEMSAEYDLFKKGEGDPYSYIKNKIFTLQLTPGRLGLEPCSGSVMVTDPESGDVLACVSYPGYDSNRLANLMDTDYYREISLNKSKPLYNHATQERTAPGSTYKMITSIAGLDSGTIDSHTVLECTGEFEEVHPSPKCWVFPGAHGGLAMSGAITNSCNCYFYQLGWMMSVDEVKRDENGNEVVSYSNIKGLSKLNEYASKFGLDQVSGLELPESKPQMSDEDSVRSAIGQGTNNFTLSQMSVYVTAIANSGKVYNFSILDHIEDKRGKTKKKYGSKTRRNMKIKSNYFDVIHQGMYDMVLNSSQFSGTFTDAGGKTGTAQESKKHPDNVLFIGYTPHDKPKYSVAVRIKNGYTSMYPAEIGNKIMRILNKVSLPEDIIGGTAYQLGSSTRSD